MPDLFGWCIAHRNDIPLSASRWCPEHQTLCLPPSWSSQTAVYPEWPPRPEGWVYSPKQLQAAVRAPQRALDASRKPFTSNPPRTTAAPQQSSEPPGALTCHQCRETYKQGPRAGGPERRFCSPLCRGKAARAARKVLRGLADGPKIVVCAECGKTADAVPATGGMRRRYCSHECGRKRNNRRNDRTPMAARGMRCEDCGRDDKPHKGRGMCSGCWDRARRREREAAA